MADKATFAVEADGPVGAANLPQLGVPHAQAAPIAPGLSAGATGVEDVNGKTFRAITELASGALAPKIKEAAQEQFIGGVQRAMTGEALGEIIADQPWYTDIFAPSSALAGARAYSAQAAIAAWAGKMQEDMPKLAQAGPEELRSAAVGALQGFLTGDAAADGLITAGVVEHMAPLFKQHAKEHYVYVQKQASQAQINAWEANAKVYQGLAAAEASGAGTVSPEDREAAKARLLASLTPFADQSDESYERNIRSTLMGAATQGNFHVIKLFKDSGLYDRIDPDKRAELDRGLAVAGRAALSKVTPQFAVEMAVLARDMTQNPKDIPAKVMALNAKAAAMTGVTEAELIPLSTLDNMIGNVMSAQVAAAAQATRNAHDAEAGPAIAASALTQAPGTVDAMVAGGLLKEVDVEQAGIAAWNAAKDPAAKAAVLNARTTKGFDTVKAGFQNVMRAEEFSAGVGNMAAVYGGLAENVKPHYFTDEQMRLMDTFTAQVRAGMPPEAAWVVSRNNASVPPFLLHDAKDEVSKTIRSYVEKENENFFGWNRVSDAALRTIEAATMRSFKANRSTATTDVAVARAYAQAKANGLDVQGKHAVINARPSDRPLYAVVGEGMQATADAFDAVMQEKAKALGVGLDNYEAIRVPDRNKRAVIYVSASTEDGRTVSWAISSDELKAHIVKGIKPASTGPAKVSAQNVLDTGAFDALPGQ